MSKWPEICDAIDCERPTESRNYCRKHYTRWYRGIDVNGKSRDDMTVEERLWHRVDQSGDCWEWFGARNFGYGYMSVDGRKTKTHRLSWEFANGPIPDGLCVLHTCDNPPCCNPDHLFLGTQADNMADMCNKNRGDTYKKKGENHSGAKLHDGDVRIIRTLVELGVKRSFVADFFDISGPTVCQIVNRKSWRHLPEEHS